ncbi:hypothetical protein Tco_0335416 [Tanacetum coccineum]
MLSLRLVAGTASEDAYTLLRFIQKQIDEYGSHDGALAIPEQMDTGKEISNPFMAEMVDHRQEAKEFLITKYKRGSRKAY